MKKIDSSRFTSLRAEEETVNSYKCKCFTDTYANSGSGRRSPANGGHTPTESSAYGDGPIQGGDTQWVLLLPPVPQFSPSLAGFKRLPSRGRGRSCVSGAADGAARPRTAGGGGPARSSFSPTPVPPLIFCELGVGRPAANPPRQVLAYRRASRANRCFTRGRLPKSRGDTRHLLAGLTRRVSARRRPWRLRGVWGGRA